MSDADALAASLAGAARHVARVAAGRSLADEALRAALLDLTHGTLRRYGRVQAIVATLSRRGRPDALVEALLWCALYALDSGRYADYTVVDQAVRACVSLERGPAKGYVNAVLRSFLRRRAALERTLRADPEACHQHPRWWIDLCRSAYPEDWERVLAAGNSAPPMTLRVNARRGSVEAYATRLAAEGLQGRPLGGVALLLPQPVPVARLPGFEGGEVSVQDYAAQRAVRCMDLQPGQAVLDACAAPGGKTAHMLESADVRVTALDSDEARCERIRRNLERLSLTACVRRADCTEPGDWWDGAPFDRILADVPCTSSGVARRHPDLKWLRRASDVQSFAARQAQILEALWQVLAPDGKLLYVTCSVFPQENEALVESFVARAQGARCLPLPDGEPQQWLPSAVHDGFFYALIHKQA